MKKAAKYIAEKGEGYLESKWAEIDLLKEEVVAGVKSRVSLKNPLGSAILSISEPDELIGITHVVGDKYGTIEMGIVDGNIDIGNPNQGILDRIEVLGLSREDGVNAFIGDALFQTYGVNGTEKVGLDPVIYKQLVNARNKVNLQAQTVRSSGNSR